MNNEKKILTEHSLRRNNSLTTEQHTFIRPFICNCGQATIAQAATTTDQCLLACFCCRRNTSSTTTNTTTTRRYSTITEQATIGANSIRNYHLKQSNTHTLIYLYKYNNIWEYFFGFQKIIDKIWRNIMEKRCTVVRDIEMKWKKRCWRQIGIRQ